MNLRELGELLRDEIEASGIPAAVIARRAGIGRTTLWMIIRGQNPRTGKPSRPAKDKLERLATVLRLDPVEERKILELAGYAETMGVPPGQPPVTPVMQPGVTAARRGFRRGAGITVVLEDRAEILKGLLSRIDVMSIQLSEMREIVEDLLEMEEGENP